LWISVKPVADVNAIIIYTAGSGLNRTPLCRYNRGMTTLKEFHQSKVNIYLNYVADLVELVGISHTSPRDADDKVSLPYALAVICGADQKCESDDFDYLLSKVPNPSLSMFIYCWEAIEAEVESDIVYWSEKAGTHQTVQRIRNLSKVIEHV